MTRDYTKKKTRFDIIRLKGDGMTTTQIANQLGCSVANVSQILLHHAQREFRIAALPPDKFHWLEKAARKADVSTGEMARCYLLDAIYQHMEEEGL